ncbi:hypothetical protein Tco_0929781 [Tanacetum coccineum]
MDLETAQNNVVTKLSLLKQENGNSFKPIPRTTANADGTSTSTIPGPVTTEEKAQKKNDIKARNMLLMALPNEHLLTFSQYKDAKTLFEAIQARFGGNDATKKTQKTLLNQLAILGENISQEDLNLKFLRSLPSEWNTHVVVWRNKPDLDTMSFDDLYNNFKIVEQEVKRTVTSSLNSSSQNMAFVSSPRNSTANLSDATVYEFLGNQPNGSQLVHKDLEQIHEDDLEEMDKLVSSINQPLQMLHMDLFGPTSRSKIHCDMLVKRLMRGNYKRRVKEMVKRRMRKLQIKKYKNEQDIRVCELANLLVQQRSTDIAKILRKRSKQDKHGIGNGIECAKAGRIRSRSTKVKPWSTKVNHKKSKPKNSKSVP